MTFEAGGETIGESRDSLANEEEGEVVVWLSRGDRERCGRRSTDDIVVGSKAAGIGGGGIW